MAGREGRLLARAVVLLPAVAVGARLVGFGRVRDALERRMPPLLTDLSEAEAAERTWWARRLLGLAVRWSPYDPNCLQRSVVLWWLLRQYGIGGELRIGVRTRDGFEAHAWVERDGRVLNDRQDIARDYPPFDHNFTPDPAAFR